VTLSLPQDIHTGATPTFAGLTINGSTSLDGAVVINESGAAVVTRIEGDTEPNLLYVDGPNDRVGIGTSAPSRTLEVEGSMMLILTGGATDLEIKNPSGAAYINPISFRDSVHGGGFIFEHARGTEASPSILQSGDLAFLIEGRGYDGSAFQVMANIMASADGAPSAGSMPGKLRFGTTPTGATAPVTRMSISEDGSLITYPDAGGAFVINENGVDADFRVEASGHSDALFVDGANGRVGIGTADPSGEVHIVSSGTIVLVESTASSATFRLQAYRESSATHGNFVAWAARGTAASPAALQNGDQIFRLSATGYDGNDFATDSHAEIEFEVDGTVSSGVVPQRINFNVPDSGGIMRTRMRIAADGGVYMYNLLAAAASTDVNINASNELHKVSSSRRFKKAIKPLEARFDSSLIYELEPVSFVWRKNTGNPDMVDFGIIAEDAYEIMPELVNLDEEGKPFSVRYSMLPVMLLAEVQKLTKRVEALEHAN